MNVSSPKTGSSSRQCTVWDEKGNTEKCLKIQLKLRITLADSRADIGHFWCLDHRRNSTEPTLTNQTDHGIEWPKTNELQGQRHAWLSDNKYRKSLSDIGWTEQDIMLFDRIALENFCTPLKRTRGDDDDHSALLSAYHHDLEKVSENLKDVKGVFGGTGMPDMLNSAWLAITKPRLEH